MDDVRLHRMPFLSFFFIDLAPLIRLFRTNSRPLPNNVYQHPSLLFLLPKIQILLALTLEASKNLAGKKVFSERPNIEKTSNEKYTDKTRFSVVILGNSYPNNYESKNVLCHGGTVQ